VGAEEEGKGLIVLVMKTILIMIMMMMRRLPALRSGNQASITR
jgi:hypothetical protein